MKIFCSILAILFLALSCIPCSDAESTIANNYTSFTTPPISKNTAHSAPQEHKDSCSPFCHCACCTIFCTIPPLQAQSVMAKAIFTGKVFSGYLQQNPIGIALPVWQPPKIGTTC